MQYLGINFHDACWLAFRTYAQTGAATFLRCSPEMVLLVRGFVLILAGPRFSLCCLGLLFQPWS